MPVYNVGDLVAAPQTWNLQEGPPGTNPKRRPRARLALPGDAGDAYKVPFQVEKSVPLDSDHQAIYTDGLYDCSAFCILYRREQDEHWSWSYLAHIPGGPNPDFIEWESRIRAKMPAVDGCRYIAVLANSRPSEGLTQTFLDEASNNLPFIPDENVWVYNHDTRGAMKFGVDFNAFAGEPD
jgi:hypothetical protein